MSAQFLTAQQIAEAELPGLPATKRRVNDRADREGWISRPRTGRGGGFEYAVQCLPAQARMALVIRELKEAQAREIAEPEHYTKADARVHILNMFERFLKGSGLTLLDAVAHFSGLYLSNSLDCPPWVKTRIPTLSCRTLRRWRAAADKHGTKALSDRQRGPAGKGRFDTDANLRLYVIAQIDGKPHVSAKAVHKGIVANFDEPPSLRSVQLFVKKFRAENAGALLAVANPDQWKSHRRAAFGSRSESVTRLNQLWEIDGTIADLQCIDTDGSLKRFSLVALVDVYSRRAKVLVTHQPSAIATSVCLREAMLEWGMPEVLKADNGKDYTAAHVKRIAYDMGIHIDYCEPFCPEQKPHVERFFGTMTRDLFELLPGYVGHDIIGRKAIESRKAMAQRFGVKPVFFPITPGELQIVINDYIRDVYSHENHSSLKCTPLEQAAKGHARRLRDERALDIMLAPAPDKNGVRTVRKDGVSVGGSYYIAAELGPLVGEYVKVRLDLSDSGRIFIFDAKTDDFVCIAEDPAQTGADRQAIAVAAKRAQNERLKAIKADFKAATDAHNPDLLAADILRHAATNSNKVHTLRARDTEASPEALKQARAAAQALDNSSHSEPAPLTDEQRENAAEKMAEIEAGNKTRANLTVYHSDPTKRPTFAVGLQGDLDFWLWASGLREQGLIDDATRAELEELEGEFSFRLHLQSHGYEINKKATGASAL